MTPNPLRPGWTTSEFWTHVLVQLLASASAILALLHPGFGVTPTIQAYVPTAAFVLALVSQLIYTVHRHGLKKTALELTQVAVVAKVPPTPNTGTPPVG